MDLSLPNDTKNSSIEQANRPQSQRENILFNLQSSVFARVIMGAGKQN